MSLPLPWLDDDHTPLPPPSSALGPASQAPGLLAISQGLSRIHENDLEMLEHGMVIYDALYAWCRRLP